MTQKRVLHPPAVSGSGLSAERDLAPEAASEAPRGVGLSSCPAVRPLVLDAVVLLCVLDTPAGRRDPRVLYMRPCFV